MKHLIFAIPLLLSSQDGPAPRWAGEIQEAAQLGLTLDGLTVKEVAAKSIGEKSALKAGDTLKKVEGKEVASFEEFLAICSERTFSHELKLEVDRGGKVQKITLKISAAKIATSGGKGGKPGKGKATLKVGGKDRTYSYRISPKAPAGPAPLLVLVHGDTWTSDEMIDTAPSEAQQQGIVVAPEGEEKTWRGSDDVEFILALIEEMKKLFNVDLRRIYIAGHSSGGMLSLKIVQGNGGLFAGAAFFGVKYVAPGQESKRRCPVLILHGGTDTIVPPAEGKKAADELKSKGWTVTYQEEKSQAHAWVPDIARKCWDWLKVQVIK